MSSKSFTLTEILIALVLTTIIILAATSVDFAARRFFQSTSKEVGVEDEARLAMEHIIKNVLAGIGDKDNPGFTIIGGTRLQVNRDGFNPPPGNGKFNPALDANDVIIEYEFRAAGNLIRFYPDANKRANFDELTDTQNPIIADCSFTQEADNRIKVTIKAREDLSKGPSKDNPETTLTSYICLREMSIN